VKKEEKRGFPDWIDAPEVMSLDRSIGVLHTIDAGWCAIFNL
jgi:hypothetical protein